MALFNLLSGFGSRAGMRNCVYACMTGQGNGQARDSASRIPEFKVCAVRIEPAIKPAPLRPEPAGTAIPTSRSAT